MTEPSKEAVEVAAKALWLEYQLEMEFTNTAWDSETEEHRNTFREKARELLEGPLLVERERWEKEVRESLSTVRGHLEGYADACALPGHVDLGQLVVALREDAEALGSIFEKGEDGG